MNDFVWIVSEHENEARWNSVAMRKFITFKKNIPVKVPKNESLLLIKMYAFLRTIKSPIEYFKDVKRKMLVIRDMGIGDILLLEPVLRALSDEGFYDVTLATDFQDVVANNPALKGTIQMDHRMIDPAVYKDFDDIIDLRMWSETSPNVLKKHRTHIYNEKFEIDLKDCEPRLYLTDEEKNICLEKIEGKKYIGLQFDASEPRRQYALAQEFIDYGTKNHPEYMFVMFGHSNDKKLTHGANVIDMRNKTEVREAIIAINNMDAFIGGDSGLVHIALALHIPTVCIFGMIDPDLRLRYYTGKKKVVVKELGCTKCYGSLTDDCKKEKVIKCMDIEPEIIFNALKSL